MKVLELFAGTRSISKAFQEEGHECFTIEIDSYHENIDWYEDVLKIQPKDIVERFGSDIDVMWLSPPCTTYSVSAIYHHRFQEPSGNLAPKSDAARLSDELVKHCLYLIKELKPKFWFIENPRGALRKMDFMQGLPRFGVTYCSYMDNRMKPTDIWSNHPQPNFKPMCFNGNKNCHHAPAPRGSSTGTQGRKSAVDKAIIPPELCKYIVKICQDQF